MSDVLATVRTLYPDTVKLLGHYSGGNDEGGYNRWTCVDSGDNQTDIDFQTVTERRDPNSEWERSAARDGKISVYLAEQLETEFWDAHGYGGFSGDFEVEGMVEIDAFSGRVLSNHGRESSRSWSEF